MEHWWTLDGFETFWDIWNPTCWLQALAFKAWYDFTGTAEACGKSGPAATAIYSSPENRHGLTMFDAFKRESYGGIKRSGLVGAWLFFNPIAAACCSHDPPGRFHRRPGLCSQCSRGSLGCLWLTSHFSALKRTFLNPSQAFLDRTLVDNLCFIMFPSRAFLDGTLVDHLSFMMLIIVN